MPNKYAFIGIPPDQTTEETATNLPSFGNSTPATFQRKMNAPDRFELFVLPEGGKKYYLPSATTLTTHPAG